ncbi:MAG: ATPase, T2SS/T4P/T4SS family [Planctomycetota bacterium]|nr:ATPase, T2SS/T4P/T4SS family [Planctomycetota bacterium]
MESILSEMKATGLLDASGAERVLPLLSAGKPLDEALVSSGVLSEEQALMYLAERFGVPYLDLTDASPEKEFLQQFPVRVLLKHRLLPVRYDNDAVLVASSRLFDTTGLEELRMATGLDCRLALAPAAEIDRCTRKYLGVGADTIETMANEAEEPGVSVLADEQDDVDLSAASGEASIITFVNQVLAEAIQLRATDVHFEPFERELRLRYRIDGVLQEVNVPPQIKQFQPAIISRLKILAQLNIAEKRLPQDGRIKLRIGGNELDVRVSVIPMLHGEGVVLRLLHRGNALLGLEQLGMSAEDRSQIARILELPHGIFLVTGPTGSGKTTTLYAALSKINDAERKIVTIEDPVEYHLRGINQIQVNTKSGLTFALGLRSILRHDPDVVLVGEIRDHETAEIAVQASLTGHLVFSTLHTNDAPGSLTRLVDMGVEPYLVASSLEGVLAQRLVRLICAKCREEYQTPAQETIRLELGREIPKVTWRGKGCRECQGTGYHGRTCICELMTVTEDIQSAILSRTSAGEIRKIAVKQGMRSLRSDGWRLVLAGRTTVEEVLRATKDEPTNGR